MDSVGDVMAGHAVGSACWVDWFDHRRLYVYCGDIPPAELEGDATTVNTELSNHPGTATA